MPSFDASGEYYDIDPASIPSPEYVSPSGDSFAYGLIPLPIPITSPQKCIVEIGPNTQRYMTGPSPCILKLRPTVLYRSNIRKGLSLKSSNLRLESRHFLPPSRALVKKRGIGVVRGWSVDDHIEAWTSSDEDSASKIARRSPNLDSGVSSIPNLMTGIFHSNDMHPKRNGAPLPPYKMLGLSSTFISSSLQDHMAPVETPLSNEPCGNTPEDWENVEDADVSDCLSPYWGSTSESDSDSPSPFALTLNYAPADYTGAAIFLHNLKMERARGRIQSTLRRERDLRRKEGLACGIESLGDGFSPLESLGIRTFEVRFPARRPRLRTFFRKIVIDWLLKVSPSPRASPTTLAVHLHANTETRFHAVQLFDRYVYLQGICCFKESTEKTTLGVGEIEDATKLHYWIWDVALSCLALSVKMYHDFTDPLHPIRSATFRSLARYSVSHEDFEIVQRHVFRSLDYEIYNTTPHAYFQEIFDALPSVRSLIRFSDSWAQVMDLAWNMMHSAMLDVNFLRYPVSLLTAATVIEALADLITIEESRHRQEVQKQANDVPISDDLVDDLGMATEDIRNILDVSQADLEECCQWISALREF